MSLNVSDKTLEVLHWPYAWLSTGLPILFLHWHFPIWLNYSPTTCFWFSLSSLHSRSLLYSRKYQKQKAEALKKLWLISKAEREIKMKPQANLWATQTFKLLQIIWWRKYTAQQFWEKKNIFLFSLFFTFVF